MATESIVDFDNHLIKCRCCLRDFELDDAQIKITPIVQLRFHELTNLELKTTENLSNVICEACNNEMRNISAFRKDLIFKQTSLLVHVEGEQSKEFEQEEVYDDYALIKSETVEIKLEPDAGYGYNSMISLEYFEPVEPEGGEEFCNSEDEFQYAEVLSKSEKRSQPKHRSEVGSKKNYKRAICGLCGNSYYKDQLQRHKDKVHYKVKRFFCDICGFGSFLKCNLSTHMAKHIAKEFREQIHCDECPATFTRIESLKNHKKTEHDENPELMKCFCGKEFNLRHKLTTHIKRTHNNARDHACVACPKRFFTPKELKLHVLKNHTPGYVDKSEHFCEICGKKYSSSKSLRTHMKHHKEPEFKCLFGGCNKGFISKLLLANHEKIHLNQRDHMCHLCEKSFFSANHLRRHIAVTHEKVRVNCFIENCRFSVGRKDYLRNHIILSHRDLSEEVKNSYLVKIRDMKL